MIILCEWISDSLKSLRGEEHRASALSDPTGKMCVVILGGTSGIGLGLMGELVEVGARMLWG